jgi:hypothetical protein
VPKGYKKDKKIIRVTSANLPGYELGSRGRELRKSLEKAVE